MIDRARGLATFLVQVHVTFRPQHWGIPPCQPCAVTFFWEEPSYNQFGDPIPIGGPKWEMRAFPFYASVMEGADAQITAPRRSEAPTVA